MKIQLEITIKEFDELHELANGKAKTIKVPRDLFMKLLMDYSTMCEYTEEKFYNEIERKE